MHTRRYPGLVVLLAAGVLACGPRPIWAEVVFRGLGDVQAGNFMVAGSGVSADGSVVVGYAGGEPGYVSAFRWTADTGVERLSMEWVVYGIRCPSISADGRVLALSAQVGSPVLTALRWTLGEQPQPLGDLPGGDVYSRAWAISADASTVVGTSGSGLGAEAFRWTAETGMVGLGDLDGGEFYSVAYGVSADGSVVVGSSRRAPTESGATLEPFRWTADGGMVGLGYLMPTDTGGQGIDVSADGSVVVGASGTEAFRWTLDGGMQGLGHLPGTTEPSLAFAVSADGAVVVGYGEVGGRAKACLWDADHGMRDLNTVLVQEYGLNLTGWDLTIAFDISADGRTIVGVGINPNSIPQAWMAVIPEPATLALVAAGGFLLLRRRGTPRRRS